LSVVFVPKNTGFLLAGFFLFRVFDVIKPPPIRKIEEVVQGGAGVMLDDILAAIYTNICLQLWKLLF
jgi:phosphatidylglycerophosphatase A